MTNTIYINQSTKVEHQMISDLSAAQSDSELLSLFISKGKHQTSLQRAQSILNTVPLSRLYNESGLESLVESDLTQRQIAMIVAGMELARRSVQQEMIHTNVLSSPQLVRNYLQLQLSSQEHEVFSALLLDNRHRVIEYTELFHGTIDSAPVYPREVVKRCLRSNAAAIIFCHNHPSGTAEPSDTDVRITRKLVDALNLIDVRVLDHLIVGKGTSTSLAERGLM